MLSSELPNNILLVKDFHKLINVDADLLCVASNTKSRLDILSRFCKNGKIKRIITEKPLSTSYKNCLKIQKIAKKNKIRLLINTHRSYSPNFLFLKNIFDKYQEKPTKIFINSPQLVLVIWVLLFFDIGLFFFNEKPKKIFGIIDKTGTVNPRGKGV